MAANKVMRVVHSWPADLEARVKAEKVLGVYICNANNASLRRIWGENYTLECRALIVPFSDPAALAKKFIEAATLKGLKTLGSKSIDVVTEGGKATNEKIFVLYYRVDKKSDVYSIELKGFQ